MAVKFDTYSLESLIRFEMELGDRSPLADDEKAALLSLEGNELPEDRLTDSSDPLARAIDKLIFVNETLSRDPVWRSSRLFDPVTDSLHLKAGDEIRIRTADGFYTIGKIWSVSKDGAVVDFDDEYQNLPKGRKFYSAETLKKMVVEGKWEIGRYITEDGKTRYEIVKTFGEEAAEAKAAEKAKLDGEERSKKELEALKERLKNPTERSKYEIEKYIDDLLFKRQMLGLQLAQWEETSGDKWYLSDFGRYLNPFTVLNPFVSNYETFAPLAVRERDGFRARLDEIDRKIAAARDVHVWLSKMGSGNRQTAAIGGLPAVLRHLIRIGLVKTPEEQLEIKLEAVRDLVEEGDDNSAMAVASGAIMTYSIIAVPLIGSVLIGPDGKASITARINQMIEMGVIDSDRLVVTSDDLGKNLEQWWKLYIRFYPENILSRGAIGPEAGLQKIDIGDIKREIMRLEYIEMFNSDAKKIIDNIKAEAAPITSRLGRREALAVAGQIFYGFLKMLDDPKTTAMVAAGLLSGPVGAYVEANALASGIGRVTATAIKLAASAVTFHAATNILSYAADPKTVDWSPESFAHTAYIFAFMGGATWMFGKFAEATFLRFAKSRPILTKIMMETGSLTTTGLGFAASGALPKLLDKDYEYTWDEFTEELISSFQMAFAFRAYHLTGGKKTPEGKYEKAIEMAMKKLEVNRARYKSNPTLDNAARVNEGIEIQLDLEMRAVMEVKAQIEKAYRGGRLNYEQYDTAIQNLRRRLKFVKAALALNSHLERHLAGHPAEVVGADRYSADFGGLAASAAMSDGSISEPFNPRAAESVADLGCGPRPLFVESLAAEGLDVVGVDKTNSDLPPMQAELPFDAERGKTISELHVESPEHFVEADLEKLDIRNPKSGERMRFDEMVSREAFGHVLYGVWVRDGEKAAMRMLKLALEHLNPGGRLIIYGFPGEGVMPEQLDKFYKFLNGTLADFIATGQVRAYGTNIRETNGTIIIADDAGAVGVLDGRTKLAEAKARYVETVVAEVRERARTEGLEITEAEVREEAERCWGVPDLYSLPGEAVDQIIRDLYVDNGKSGDSVKPKGKVGETSDNPPHQIFGRYDPDTSLGRTRRALRSKTKALRIIREVYGNSTPPDLPLQRGGISARTVLERIKMWPDAYRLTFYEVIPEMWQNTPDKEAARNAIRKEVEDALARIVTTDTNTSRPKATPARAPYVDPRIAKWASVSSGDASIFSILLEGLTVDERAAVNALSVDDRIELIKETGRMREAGKTYDEISKMLRSAPRITPPEDEAAAIASGRRRGPRGGNKLNRRPPRPKVGLMGEKHEGKGVRGNKQAGRRPRSGRSKTEELTLSDITVNRLADVREALKGQEDAVKKGLTEESYTIYAINAEQSAFDMASAKVGGAEKIARLFEDLSAGKIGRDDPRFEYARVIFEAVVISGELIGRLNDESSFIVELHDGKKVDLAENILARRDEITELYDQLKGRVDFNRFREIFYKEMRGPSEELNLSKIPVLPDALEDADMKEFMLGEADIVFREARILEELAAKGVINVTRLCGIYKSADGERLYPLVEGMNRELLEYVGATAREQVVTRFIDYLYAIEGIHRSGYVHNDLIGENLRVGVNGKGIVAGLGNSFRPGEYLTDDAVRGAAGSGMITPESFALKSGRTLPPPGQASDIYALGIALYEAVTDDNFTTLRKHLEDFDLDVEAEMGTVADQDELEGIRALGEIVQMATKYQPAERYQSAKEMRTALENWLVQYGILRGDEGGGSSGGGNSGEIR